MCHVHTHAHGYTNRRNLPRAHTRNTARTDPKTRIHAHECTGACKYTRTNSRTPMHARTYAHARTHTCTLSHTRAHACARSLAPTRALPHTPWHALTRHGKPSHMAHPHMPSHTGCDRRLVEANAPAGNTCVPCLRAYMHAVRCNVVLCRTGKCGAVPCKTVLCSAVWYHTARHSAARRGGVPRVVRVEMACERRHHHACIHMCKTG